MSAALNPLWDLRRLFSRLHSWLTMSRQLSLSGSVQHFFASYALLSRFRRFARTVCDFSLSSMCSDLRSIWPPKASHVLFRLVLPSPSSRQSDAPWTSTVTPMQTLFLERPLIVLPSALRRRSSESSGHYVSSSHILSKRVAPSWQGAITPKSFAVHYAGVSKERWWPQAHAASLLLLKDLRQEHGPLRDREDASSRRVCRSQT